MREKRSKQSKQPKQGVGKAERRQQLLDQARTVFAKRGYHAAKIDEIVAAAGVARGTFYLYFEDKRAIFEEIVDRTIARIGMTILRVDPHDAGRPVAEQVKENIRRLVRMLLEDRAITKILLSDTLGVDPAFDRKLLSFYGEVVSLLEHSIGDGQKLGIVRDGDARLYAYLTLGALKEVLFQIVQRGAEYAEEDLVDRIFAFFRDGYLQVASGEAVREDASHLTESGGARSAAAPRLRTARPSPRSPAPSRRPPRPR